MKIPDRDYERKNLIQVFEVNNELERNEEALRKVFSAYFEKTKNDLIRCGHSTRSVEPYLSLQDVMIIVFRAGIPLEPNQIIEAFAASKMTVINDES